jgi:hypothetical protein
LAGLEFHRLLKIPLRRAFYQGTTSVVPQAPKEEPALCAQRALGIGVWNGPKAMK